MLNNIEENPEKEKSSALLKILKLFAITGLVAASPLLLATIIWVFGLIGLASKSAVESAAALGFIAVFTIIIGVLIFVIGSIGIIINAIRNNYT